MKQLVNTNDKYKMNWVEGTTGWGTVKCPKELMCERKSKQIGDSIVETIFSTSNSYFHGLSLFIRYLRKASLLTSRILQ